MYFAVALLLFETWNLPLSFLPNVSNSGCDFVRTVSDVIFSKFCTSEGYRTAHSVGIR
jgi:hypothetical protein